MERRVLPLLLASSRFASPEESQPLDRLRVQKGVFLLEQRGPTSWRESYTFRPYDWGPFSRELAQDLGDMQGEELTIVRFEGLRYGEYQTTPEGNKRIDSIFPVLPEATAAFVRSTRRFVTTRSFSRLLQEVYGAYPQYATRSRFSG
jgi:hypothetical protein